MLETLMAGLRCQTSGISKTEFWRTHNSTLSITWSRLNKLLERVRPEGVTDLWLSLRKPHKPVSTQTICKWLKKVIVDSGALSGSARDVRSVGSSDAAQAGLDIGKIMQFADWRRVRTFQSLKPLFVSEA